MKRIRRDRALTAMLHRVPLEDFDAQVLVPRDLTKKEAERIVRLVRTLATEVKP